MNKIENLTAEQKKLIQDLSNLPFEILDAFRSVLHSAAIKKGYTQPKLVLDELKKMEGVINSCLEKHIPFTKINVPQDYSQPLGYKVDVYVETETNIYLVDPKGPSHNNNTPISDEVKKWVYAKQQMELTHPNKRVRFILLKPSDVDEYEFNRLKSSYLPYGIELHETDVFLSEMSNENVSVSNILKENKYKLMVKGLQNLIG